MGLGFVCSLLQGLHSATPRYTPAYTLAAPNGAQSGCPKKSDNSDNSVVEKRESLGDRIIFLQDYLAFSNKNSNFVD
jgi:hypothetical protein